jgi:2-oxoglutarate ferredoxin oxidoreductase subunit beta
VYDINDEGDYNPEDRMRAFERAQEWGERIPIGIVYKAERSTLNGQESAIKEMALVKQTVDQAAFEGILEIFR